MKNDVLGNCVEFRLFEMFFYGKLSEIVKEVSISFRREKGEKIGRILNSFNNG